MATDPLRREGESTEAEHDVPSALRAVQALALARFPREQRTLGLFFDELGRQLGDGPPAEAFTELLDRLEELLEALLVGEAHGLVRRAPAAEP
jgi:hypothetical protein